LSCLGNTAHLVSYDLVVETSGALREEQPSFLNKLYNETIEAIRRIATYRVIIVTPGNTSSPSR
jgi:hypothetical protein